MIVWVLCLCWNVVETFYVARIKETKKVTVGKTRKLQGKRKLIANECRNKESTVN